MVTSLLSSATQKLKLKRKPPTLPSEPLPPWEPSHTPCTDQDQCIEIEISNDN